MTDTLVRAIAGDGGIKMTAVLTTEATKEAALRHNLSYLTSVLLGRGMTGALLLASSMKVLHGRVTLKIQSDGPLKGLIADAGRDGTVRGYVGNPTLELDLIKKATENYSFDFKTATGTGYLHVIRDEGKEEPFTSTVELVEGGIAEDIATYLLHSEQTPSAVFIGEKITSEKLICSGGLIAQILPKSENNHSLIRLLEEKCSEVTSFSEKLLSNRNKISNIFEELFPELQPKLISSKGSNQNIFFNCKCSKDKSLSALKLLGHEELDQIIEEDGKAELKCHFCSTTYNINIAELKTLRDS